MIEEQMSQSDFDAQAQRWIAEEYEKQWAESLAQIDEATIHQIAQVEATKRVRAEMERNPAFREALLNRCAKQWTEEHSNEYLQAHRPNGRYRDDVILTLNHKNLVKMCDATRDYVVQWARHETTRATFNTSCLGSQCGTTQNTRRWPIWKGTRFRTGKGPDAEEVPVP